MCTLTRLRGRLGPLLLGAILALPAGAGAQAAFNTELLGQWDPLVGRSSYNDIWGYDAPDGTALAIVGLQNGVAFVDVTDPANPVQVGIVDKPATTHRDMRTFGTYAYAVNETGGGMSIIDLSRPRQPIEVAVYDLNFDTAHNIGIYEGFAYVVGARLAGVPTGTHILDLSNPVAPVEVGRWNGRYVHDIYVRDDIAYASAINDRGLAILDVSDKANPREISFTPYPDAATHAAWLNDAGTHLLTADEIDGGHLRVWDVRNLASPIQVAEWTANPAAIIHNVFVRGDSAYLSYYTEGLQVLDITNPEAPFRVAAYDTWPGVSGGFSGNWGAFPFTRSGYVYLSDMSSGLFVVKLVEGNGAADFALVAPPMQMASPGQGALFYFFEIQNLALEPRTYDITASSSLGWTLDAPATLTVPGASSDLVTVRVDVPPAIATPTAVDVEVCATSRATQLSTCVRTETPTAVVLETFTAAALPGGGVELAWTVGFDAGDRGRLVILRGPAADATALERRAVQPLASGRWVDPEVAVGTAWVYHLAFESAAGLQVLGTRTVEVSSTTPLHARLLGNWPNPFNPGTRIRFELARPGAVAVRVFDGRGRILQVLDGGRRSAGRHDVAWNGRDRAGNPVPSGVYFYEVRSGPWRARGRMTLVR